MKIKQHEDNIKFLRTQKNKLDESILDLQSILFTICVLELIGIPFSFVLYIHL